MDQVEHSRQPGSAQSRAVAQGALHPAARPDERLTTIKGGARSRGTGGWGLRAPLAVRGAYGRSHQLGIASTRFNMGQPVVRAEGPAWTVGAGPRALRLRLFRDVAPGLARMALAPLARIGIAEAHRRAGVDPVTGRPSPKRVEFRAMLSRVSHGDDILAHARSPGVKGLYTKWRTLAQTKRLTLTEFLEVGPKSADRFTVLQKVGDDFYFTYHGAGFRETLGYDLSGKYLTEIGTGLAREMQALYGGVCRSGQPAHAIFAAEAAKKYALVWERLVLPLTVRGETSLLLVHSEVVNSTFDIYEYMFLTAPTLVIGALPILAADGTVTDAAVVMSNPAAEDFFHIAPAAAPTLRGLEPWFADDAVWRMLIDQPHAEARERVIAEQHQGRTFRIVVNHLGAVMLFRILDATGGERVVID